MSSVTGTGRCEPRSPVSGLVARGEHMGRARRHHPPSGGLFSHGNPWFPYETGQSPAPAADLLDPSRQRPPNPGDQASAEGAEERPQERIGDQSFDSPTGRGADLAVRHPDDKTLGDEGEVSVILWCRLKAASAQVAGDWAADRLLDA